MHIAIIGAGFSGLCAAYLCEQAGHQVTVYEKAPHVGGHCHSLRFHKGHVELGTVVSFSKQIKKLMIALQVEYQERFVYRNFIDAHYEYVDHLRPDDILLLQSELLRLKELMRTYDLDPRPLHYGTIHPDLTISCAAFLAMHQFVLIDQIIEPYLSSFGFGSLHSTAAYYVFHAFDLQIIEALLQGDRFLFATHGMRSLTDALAAQLRDLRYEADVVSIEEHGASVSVSTALDTQRYDRVLLTCPLDPDILKNETQAQWMRQLHTHPYVTCVFEVENKDLVTTYYKKNFSQPNKLQFFTVTNLPERTLLVAHAYGTRCKTMVEELRDDLAKSKIQINHLIASKQWSIFPHIPQDKLQPTIYITMLEAQKQLKIQWIGSLVTNPSIDQLYRSISAHIATLQP